MDTIVLGILENLKKQEVTFMITNPDSDPRNTRKGRVVAVHGRVVHLWEGYHKRKLNIKNLLVYHPAIFAALTLHG
jgi:hypothetical protein